MGLVVFIPDHRLSFYFASFNFLSLDEQSLLLSKISEAQNFI